MGLIVIMIMRRLGISGTPRISDQTPPPILVATHAAENAGPKVVNSDWFDLRLVTSKRLNARGSAFGPLGPTGCRSAYFQLLSSALTLIYIRTSFNRVSLRPHLPLGARKQITLLVHRPATHLLQTWQSQPRLNARY